MGSVTAESFCENNHTGQWQCANDNPSPVSAITYSASQLTANKIAFAFELYWNMKGKLPQANYATVNPFFLNVKQTLVLKCAEEDSVD